jgi:hypothetical protein
MPAPHGVSASNPDFVEHDPTTHVCQEVTGDGGVFNEAPEREEFDLCTQHVGGSPMNVCAWGVERTQSFGEGERRHPASIPDQPIPVGGCRLR